jgi:hypothetical protein
MIGDTLAPERPFLVKQATMLVEILRCRLFLQLNGHQLVELQADLA